MTWGKKIPLDNYEALQSLVQNWEYLDSEDGGSRSKISKFIPKIVVFEIYRICILNKMLSNSVPKCGIAFVQAFNDEKGNLVGRLM